MKHSISTIVAAFAFATSTSYAMPGLLYPEHHTWSPPTDSDVRSPCPCLNSLSNHGFLPHSGRNLTMDKLIKAFKEGVNLGPDATTFAGGLAMKSNPIPNATWFDLDMLDQHNFPIEHDGSLSRADAYFGNNHDFSPEVWGAYMARLEGHEIISIELASKARAEHVYAQSLINPEFFLNEDLLGDSLLETALLISIFGDPALGNAKKSWIESFFRNERFPVSEGWEPRADEANLTTATAMIGKLQASLPEGVPILFGNQPE
ncbi:uncharacterized protein BP5553_00460 [Venustampulla echinocandica]|uniref:Heme haloperoxidase family profile domain-containing protein n=1 Tax=Venustampulla echinocandica TaxID=2656787 RepID=A0A370TY91_9HELO|nr:uncharacterized protein BP5553_00460 [Venustampulla echinocandica]RDL40481.1 hypothetical protein BP5553_00460 [Venustampulla echinocandica]